MPQPKLVFYDVARCIFSLVRQRLTERELARLPTAEFWQRVLWILHKHGWSERQLAELARLGESTINKIILRKQQDAKKKTAEKIALASGVSLIWLREGIGQPEHYEARMRREYPSKRQASEKARSLGVTEEAIRKMLALYENHADDPGWRYWLQRALEFDDARDSGSFPAKRG